LLRAQNAAALHDFGKELGAELAMLRAGGGLKQTV
jgi:hypothetical protein